jgi:hypothetical protein
MAASVRRLTMLAARADPARHGPARVDCPEMTEAGSVADKKWTARLSTSLLARIVFAAGLAATLAFPALAQDGTVPMPDNGRAWDSDPGFRREKGACVLGP